MFTYVFAYCQCILLNFELKSTKMLKRYNSTCELLEQQAFAGCMHNNQPKVIFILLQTLHPFDLAWFSVVDNNQFTKETTQLMKTLLKGLLYKNNYQSKPGPEVNFIKTLMLAFL